MRSQLKMPGWLTQEPSPTGRKLPNSDQYSGGGRSLLLDGSPTEAADRIRRFHNLGISYFTFHKSAATSWNTLAALTAAVK